MSNTKTVMSQAANTQGIPLDITDVFSTYLYEGKGAAGPSGGQTITNGIDLAGEGGLVWVKSRNNAYDHRLTDTERGIRKSIETQSTEAEADTVHCVSGSFNSDGFSIGDTGTPSAVNTFGDDYASWTFRKAPKFFDIVTYTGDGTQGRQISHNLGSVPGMIIVKSTSATDSWNVYHRSCSDDNASWCQSLFLNSTGAEGGYGRFSPHASQTDTHFSFYDGGNTNGVDFVAYLFAHNDGDGGFGPSGDQDIIKCGSFTTDGSGVANVDLGFEPAWLLTKASSTTSYWALMDEMRGFGADVGMDYMVQPNTSNAEVGPNYLYKKNATGFSTASLSANQTYIYMAIRRGPLAPPESATEVFDVSTRNASEPAYTSGFPVDFAFARAKNIANNWATGSRLQQGNRMFTNLDNAEASNSNMMFDYQEGWSAGTGASTDHLSWMWKRAPNYFDVVAYSGNQTAGHNVSHNLGVAPEMMWVKARNLAREFVVYHKDIGNSKAMDLETATVAGFLNYWNYTTPIDTVFTVGDNSRVNDTGYNYIAYLFASLDGISKVGSYTGNGTSQTIDCGFTSGARFVLVKCTTVGYDWQVFDTERGIVAGNDSKLALNTTQAEQTNVDFIDPSSSGFTVTSSSSMNANGETFIFYAIA